MRHAMRRSAAMLLIISWAGAPAAAFAHDAATLRTEQARSAATSQRSGASQAGLEEVQPPGS